MPPRLRTGFEKNMFLRSSGRKDADQSILWIHGLGESGLCFEEVITDERLVDWRHLAPDLPGYGKSPWPQVPMSIAAYADHLAEWLTERGEGPVVVIGHSMGGVIGTFLAERFPERVRAILDVEGNISEADCTTSGQVVERSRDEFLSSGFPALLQVVWREGGKDEAFRTYYPSLRMCDPRCLHMNSVELVELSREEMLAMRLRGLKMPRVYLYGADGGTGERSRELLEKAGITHIGIDGSAHWPFIDRPDAFVEAVISALDGV
jgi:pimeloyl-ACP methyl ester carboxylesterase